MSHALTLISTGGFVLPAIAPSMLPEAIRQKENALSHSALIGKVDTQEDNDRCTAARKHLQLWRTLDKERKFITDPLYEFQRTVKRIVDVHIDELQKEDARLENLQKSFAFAEQKRKREEEEAQQRELDRIERERQAELQRIADEQACVERVAREAREAAERAAREATNKAEREAAAKAHQEALALQKEADKAAVTAENQTAAVQENADLRARLESKPVEITRARGQTVRPKMKITSIDKFKLMRAHPDLVTDIQFDMLEINRRLNAGVKLTGVEAEEDMKISVRGKAPALIEV